MKKTTIIIGACLMSMVFSQCAKKTVPTSSTATAKSKTPAEEVADVKKEYTPERIAQGKIIFDNHCGKCHELKQPGEFTIKDWNRILPGMVRKAKLEEANAGVLRAWIITNAKAE